MLVSLLGNEEKKLKLFRWVLFILGFILLTAYFQGMNLWLDGVAWVIFALLFFVFAHYICKISNLHGIQSLGYVFHKGWARNLLVGFLFGFGSWGVMYGSFFLLGRYELIGIASTEAIIWLVIQALVGMFLGSTINDAIVRGYFFAHLRNRISLTAIIFITAIVYAFDDIWFEGFSLFNSTFSILLGLSLAIAFAKTHSIWFTTGIHFGLNVMYCLMYGLPGTDGHGGIIIYEVVASGFLYNGIQLVMTLLLLIMVYLYFRKKDINKEKNQPLPFEG